MEAHITFTPVKALMDVQFWLHFTNLKLDEWKLTSPKREIQGTIPLPMSQTISSNLSLTDQSFKTLKKKTIGGLINSAIQGTFIHTNTIEEYSAYDILQAIQEDAQLLTKEYKDFTNVNRFLVVSFGDLKNYNYHSKFIQIELKGTFDMVKSQKANVILSKEDLGAIINGIKPLIQTHEEQFAFITTLNKETNIYETSNELSKILTDQSAYLCYFDPSPTVPSILLKNYLVKLNQAFQNESQLNDGETFTIKLLSIRDKLSKLSEVITLDNTFYIEIKFTKNTVHKNQNLVVELPDLGKIQTNKICLKEQLDSKTIAENAVDLNLKLMKWRMLPGLDLDILRTSSCLLLGSGSLGCQVSRNLLSWGFRKITFVDAGKVSYSNPVRQCLFTFEDSTREDNDKAKVAAQRLSEIFPSVETRGEILRIPMPGHAFGNEEAVKDMIKDMYRLEDLIKEHDVIFLLTDSRESRWLPTVQALALNKICLTIALGFESFLVMRHGLSTTVHDQNINGSRLGCYFCNDVVAPRDSLSDRTLDQQCTVSRPALCCIASSLGVELLASMLNHPLKNGAKAHEDKYECDKSDLGYLPQQIRGDLSSFAMNAMFGEAFDRCIGCSGKVVEQYLQDKEAFVLRACNKPDYLEELTGITEMMSKIKYDEIESFDFDEEM